jgi:hypothetical protein
MSTASNSDKANWLLVRADCYRQLDQSEHALIELERALVLLRESPDTHTEADVYDIVARTHFECFRRTGLLEHKLGCANAASALYALADRHPYIRILASKLREDLAKPDLDDRNQLRYTAIAPEQASNFFELTEIDRLRQQSIADPDPAAQLNARLGIARIYLELSIKERQNALALAEAHNLLASTTEAVLAMADLHARTLDSRDLLISRWQELSGLDVALIRAVLSHFEQHGALSKKAYIALAGVSAATASRVLARLVAAGLITQHGAGAATRYARTDARVEQG